ncbi:alpha/beta hydrolase [Kitasatospora griseola]|uniref:alpha/beta hydrolase n=1 Tax=Kitasatospora griseola TaxID=2064 RepID=UPI00381A2F00
MDISLLDGWFPWTVRALAVAALLAVIGRRERTWWQRRLPVAVAAAAGTAALLAVGVLELSGITDSLPTALWIWLGVALLAVLAVALGRRGARWWHWAAAPVAVLLAVLAGANTLNAETGYYPTLGDAVGELSGSPVPDQMSLDQALHTTGRTGTGRVVAVDVPADPSGFAHRQELVYLPPAWFRSKTRPKLPVVEMVGGEFAAPDNWVRAGNAVKTADRYAAKHNGFSPVLVFADATGGFKVDTECVDGPAGNAADHLVKDLPKYVEKTFNASADPKKWAMAGWSMGGTCAITLTAAHPEVFGHFLDISGDLGPYIGDKQQTIAKLYGGDAAAWAAYDPQTVMAAHRGKYRGVTGMFDVGDQESGQLAHAKQLEAAAGKAGLSTHLSVEPGRHAWQFAAGAFERQLPWLAQQLGTPGTAGKNPPAAAG